MTDQAGTIAAPCRSALARFRGLGRSCCVLPISWVRPAHAVARAVLGHKLHEIRHLALREPGRSKSDREGLAIQAKLKLHSMAAGVHEEVLPHFRGVHTAFRLGTAYVRDHRPKTGI